jgi:hypothetical protein
MRPETDPFTIRTFSASIAGPRTLSDEGALSRRERAVGAG